MLCWAKAIATLDYGLDRPISCRAVSYSESLKLVILKQCFSCVLLFAQCHLQNGGGHFGALREVSCLPQRRVTPTRA